MTLAFVSNYNRTFTAPTRNRNIHNLTVDTQFLEAFIDFESQYDGILSIRKGDIIAVKQGGDQHPKWWLGTVIRSYYGTKGYGYFFPVITKPYTFMDDRIAARIPRALFDIHGDLRRFGDKSRKR
ncbi:hypothetical protein GGI15_001629 [Coemansia interrupta]|uniref:SH3 domain-containing protein n=1 Tax=Coemansia interrupta TaxID=1126814 RepID=A0A9W8LNF7_9FUNG|nr:hypothetical protein GGI15_001629 [Coemansia interrupta]